MRRATIDSVVERVTRRPRLVRDRVLAAKSDDGLSWRKESRPPITHPSHRRPHMTYFTAHDGHGCLWVRASVHDAATGRWHTEIGRDGRWFDVRAAGIEHLYAPAWVGDVVYGVAIPLGGGRGRPACFATGAEREPVRELPQEWEAIDRYAVVEDLCILELAPDQRVAFMSVGESRARIAIHRWLSHDGTRWEHRGTAIETPFASAYELANNPSVVALDDGTWRAYFRTGTRAVLGNAIVSARSDDLARWRHESGDRIAPGGQWGNHGVGFPHVWRSTDGSWRMLYAGYWGRTRAAEATRAQWIRTGREIEAR